MVARLRTTLRRPQVLLAKSVVAWRAACSQAEGASIEAEAQAEAVKAWKLIDQLS